MPDEPNHSTNYMPPTESPSEGFEPAKDRSQQQSLQENNQVIQEPTGKKTSVRDSLFSFIFIVLFYWILYLFINYYIRISNSRGFYNFPLPPSDPEGIYILFLFIPIVGSVSSIVVFFIYKFLGSVRIILFIPAVLLISTFVFSPLVPLVFGCQGLGCLGYAAILMTLMYIVASLYASIFLNNIVLNLVRKYSPSFVILFIFFGITLMAAFLVPKLPALNFEDRVVQNKEVKILKTSFEKEEISTQIHKLNNGDSNRCCSILEKRPSGEFVLKKLARNKFLVGGLIQENPDSDNYSNAYWADLYLEENGKLTNITKGLDFMLLYDKNSFEGSGTRPAMISPSMDRIAFFKRYISDPVLYMVNLDGSGVFMDENFCPMGWNCSRISWANDGYIYIHGKRHTSGLEEKEAFWKVTPPKSLPGIQDD